MEVIFLKRIVIFLLVFILVFSSVASAAPGDIIHTGLKKIYRKGNMGELINDITNGGDSIEFLNKFYKELDDGRFVNVAEEEKAHLAYIESLVKNPVNNIKTADDLLKYMVDNKANIDDEFSKITNSDSIAKTFEQINDSSKGNLEDYKGNSEAPRLKTPGNYTIPVPGSGDNTTQIVKLARPTGVGATKWLYKIIDTPTYPKLNDVLVGGITYRAGDDISISEGKYLLLSATDNDNKVKSYASIRITADMIKSPRVIVEADNGITPSFTASENKSGATVVSGSLGEGTWKAALLNDPMDTVYEDSSFVGSESYKDGMELVVASDAEVDGGLVNFKKYLILYRENDKKIEKYNILEIPKDKVSGALGARKLDVEPGNPIFTKGNISESTQISQENKLDLPTNATKWMYAFVDDDTVIPKLDRVYSGSVGYSVGQDIKVTAGDYLMLLATDDSGKVKAYRIVGIIDGMIRDPLADNFQEFRDYSMPERGTSVGTTKFQHLNYDGAELYYELSDKSINVPEKDSDLPSHISGNKILNPSYLADNIKIFEPSDAKLRDANGFTKYMIIYAVKDGKIIAATHENFRITPDNVRLPDATKLPWANYKDSESGQPLKPGTSANSTMLKKLDKNNIDGAGDLKYVYTFVSQETTPGINEIIRSTRSLEAGKELTPANLGEYLLILLVDNSNRTKYYANVELTYDNIRSSNALTLVDGKHYSYPKPGTSFGSTRFDLLALDDINGATKFMVAVSNVPFRAVELDSTVDMAVDYATINPDKTIKYIESPDKINANGDILGVDAKDKRYLLLLATDANEKVKRYQIFNLTENSIRGDKAKHLTSTNFTIGMGSKPGTIKFTKLSNFNIGNTNWMYKWAEEDVFTSNPPFEGQIIADGDNIRTKSKDQYSVEGIDDIKVGITPNYGYILLLATNGNRVLGYTVIQVKEADVQITADVLKIDLGPGNTPDSTKIIGNDKDKSKKYIVSTTPFAEEPGPNTDLPRTGVRDVPSSKEISVRAGEHLRIFDVDATNKVIGYKDFEITLNHIKQGSATLKVLNHADKKDNIYEILEGRIKANAIKIEVKLVGASWADVINDRTIRDAFIDGFKADGTEQGEWNKILQKIRDGRYSISKTGDTLTITTTVTEDYDISKDQRITLTIPPRAIVGAINPIKVNEEIVIKPTIDGKLSGSMVNNIRQSQINSGNATIFIDVVDSKWIDNIEATENKQAILDGIDDVGGFISDGGVSSPWRQLKDIIKQNLDNIRLIDPQRISITIPKNEIKIDSPETITLTIHMDLIDDAKSHIVAAPAFTIYPDILPIGANVDGTVILEAPKYVNSLKDNDTWLVNLDGNITFKDDFSATKDITTSSLPSGLKLEISKMDNKQLSIKLVGKASKELTDGAISLVIKSSAIKEKNYSDSKTISLEYKQGDKINLDNVTYEIKTDGIYLKINDSSIKADDLMYSTNSTNGSTGTWMNIPPDYKISDKLEPVTIYVKETTQPDNFRLMGKLVNSPAPTGIMIENYDYVNAELTLNEYSNLQYNLGTPNNWEDVPNTKIIPSLSKDSVLVVRKKALEGIGEEGTLPSLPTPKLNGLFLGDVKLDVGESKIDKATTQMQYSLNSDENGNGGSWSAIKTPNPVIGFANDNIVWIREGSSELNKRKLGKVKQIEALPTNFNLVDYNIREKTLVNKSDIDLQYRIANGNWFTLGKRIDENTPNVVNNVIFAPGNIELRRKGSSDTLPSNSIIFGEIPLPINPPELRFDNDLKTIKYKDDKGAFRDLDDDFEYKLGIGGDWKNGSSFTTDEGIKETVTVFVRKKASDKAVASKEVSYNFTKGISLVNVIVNVATGIIDGTTINMEYSTDSTDGKNGNWIIASNGKTSIKFVPNMNLYIREKGKPSTSKKLLLDLKREANPILKDITYDVSYDAIYNPTEQILEYRITEGSWTRIDSNSNKVPAGLKAGKLEFRKPATAETLESLPITKDSPFDIIMVEGSAPVVEFNDTKNKVISINSKTSSDWDIFEYRLDSNSPNAWSKGVNLDTQDLSGDKNVEIRIKATSTTLSSKIATIKFTKNLELGLVTLSDYTKPYELNGTTTDMEYKIIYLDGNEVGWNKCLKDATPLTDVTDTNSIAQVILRDGRLGHRDNERILINNADSAPTGIKIIKYTYDTDGKLTVKLQGVDNTMEYTIAPNSWTTVNANEIDVPIEKDSDLRVRFKATDDKLASISTPRLNGLYLGKISIDDSKLIDTNTSMEYSLDGGATWELAKDGKTPIEVTKGNKIMIRQLNNLINVRTLGEVNIANLPVINDIDYSIKNQRIVADTNLEYRINGGPWVSITENPVNNVMFIPGKLEFRTKSSGLQLASEPITKAIIPNPVDTPDIRPVDTGKKSIEYYNTTFAWLELDNTFEYKIGSNGSWKPYSDFESDPLKNGKVMVFVRKAATHKTLPTIEKYIDFDANLTFSNVRVNVAKGVIENTTNAMEFSINSTDGLNGAWNPVSNGTTNVSFVEGMNVWIREKGKPDNYKQILYELQRHYLINSKYLEFDIAMGTISNTSAYDDLEFRINKGNWQKLAANTTVNVNFTEGSLEFRNAATTYMLESLPKEKAVIKAATSPSIVVFDDVNNMIVSIDGSESYSDWENYQYRIIGESENWAPGELLKTDIDLSGDKIVEIRRKANTNTLASQIAQVRFTKNLELSHITLSTHVKPLELNGTTADMEFKVWLTNGSNTWVFNNGSEWTQCDEGNTKLHASLTDKTTASIHIHKIVIRDRRESQRDNEFVVYPQP